MRRLFLCLICLALPAVAAAQETKDKPILVLNTGGHTGEIGSVMFSPDGAQLISVGEDNTIRSWSVKSGEALQVMRPPSSPGPGPDRSALSPDGRILALPRLGTEASDTWIYLIDRLSGKVERILKGHSDGVLRLAFSPDGKLLASASKDQTARIWDVTTGECNKVLRGHTAWIGGVAFSPDGKHLATTARDVTCRIWSVTSGESEAVLKDANEDGRYYWMESVAWSPDGQTVVTGSFDYYIRLWKPNGTFLKRFKSSARGAIRSLTFTADSGELLVTAQTNAYIMDLKTGKERSPFSGHRLSGVWTGALSPDGKLAATASYGDELFIWNTSDGRRVHRLAGLEAHPTAGAAWSPDGKVVAWRPQGSSDPPKPNAVAPLETSFNLSTLEYGVPPKQDWRRSQATQGNLSVERIFNDGHLEIKEGGRTITTFKGNFASGWTFLPDEQIAFANHDGFGIYEARTGKRLRKFQQSDAGVGSVAPSPDNRCLLTSGDSIIRVWILDKEAPLLSIFAAGGDWVAWTPEGYYAASPGGEQLMGWQVNNGAEKMASYYSAAQFRKTLYRPDVIKRLLKAGSLDKALTQADEDGGKSSRHADVAQILPPKVVVTSPKTVTRLDKSALHVEAVATGAEGNPVASLRLLLDGRPYGADDALKKFRDAKPGDVRASWDVDVPSGSHRLAVQATGTASVGMSDEVEVAFTPTGQTANKDDAGSLYVLAVGINDYPGKLKLQCAVPDARLITQTFKDEGKGLFHKVDVKLLTDKDATRSGILQGLRWLRDNAKPGDVAIAFYAGHGDCKIAGRFFLIPVDANLKDLPGTGVSGDELKAGLADLPCSTVLLLDACYSGSIDAKRKKRALPGAADGLVRDFTYDAGLVVLCGAAKEQEAAEEGGHGFFTKAIAEGLKGKASKDRQGLVTLFKLQDYVHDRVQELSGGEQEPTISIPSTVRSFPLAKP